MSRLAFVFAFEAALFAMSAAASAAPAAAPAKLACPAYNPTLQTYGNPPSGEVPIIYNDHHVYAKPDRLRRNRVLAGLVRGTTMLVPICNMIQDIGADAVTFDPATKTLDVSKPGTEMILTVDKPLVTIDGETRPIDVPPEMYRGAVVVPVRLIAEQFGAYVYWQQKDRTTIVRRLFAAPTAPPTPVSSLPPFHPTAAPIAIAPPTAAPTPLDCPFADDETPAPKPLPTAVPAARP